MNDDIQKRIFTRNLNSYIEASGKTQLEIAKSIGVSPQTFNTWCKGIALPRMGKVQALADYFHINKSDLIESRTRTESIPEILSYYNSLNDMGKQEATKRVKELTYIPQYTARGPLLNAAHEIKGSSDEDKQHDEELLNKLYNNRNKG